jgi:hypothetical protein
MLRTSTIKIIKHLKKEIEDGTRRKDTSPPCSWIGRINFVKMAVILKAMYRLNAIPTKIPMAFFTEQKILKFT